MSLLEWKKNEHGLLHCGHYHIELAVIGDKKLYLVHYQQGLIGESTSGNAARKIAAQHAKQQEIHHDQA